jgi:hypothetical protein
LNPVNQSRLLRNDANFFKQQKKIIKANRAVQLTRPVKDLKANVDDFKSNSEPAVTFFMIAKASFNQATQKVLSEADLMRTHPKLDEPGLTEQLINR